MATSQRTTRYVSPRTRFEIFKRDDFACQYCGRRAPDVTLHLDHILAVANGGADDPMNLLTACSECNSGKSDVPLERVITPVDPIQRAREIREMEEAIRAYNEEVLARDERIAEDRKQLYDYFLDRTGWSCMRPPDFNWLMSVVDDVPLAVVLSKIDAAERSMRPKRAWIPYLRVCIRRWREEGY